MKIFNRYTNDLVFEDDNKTIRETVLNAINQQASLSRANLSRANLNEANLSRANLSGANLTEANLTWASPSWANLSRANLSRANLSRANLSRANLSRANLSGANLSWANLSRANLSRANLSEANLTGANLTGAKGLLKMMGVEPGNTYWKRFGENLINEGYQFYVGINNLRGFEVFAADERKLCSYPGFHFASRSRCTVDYSSRPLEARIRIPEGAQINEPWATDGKASASAIEILQVFDVETGEDVTELYRRK